MEEISSLAKTEEWISNLEDKVVEITKAEPKNKEKVVKRKEDSLRGCR